MRPRPYHLAVLVAVVLSVGLSGSVRAQGQYMYQGTVTYAKGSGLPKDQGCLELDFTTGDGTLEGGQGKLYGFVGYLKLGKNKKAFLFAGDEGNFAMSGTFKGAGNKRVAADALFVTESGALVMARIKGKLNANCTVTRRRR